MSDRADVRARLLGALVLLAVFAAGVMAGTAWSRMRPQGINVNVRMTTELPRELRRLDLSPTQEDTLRRILTGGQERTLKVLRDFEPRMRATMDSLDAEIHTVLTPSQRTAFDASRRTRVRDLIEQEFDTVRR